MELIRLHKRDRHETYLPTASPIPDEYLDSTRKTIYEFTSGRKLTKEDQWKTTVGKKQSVTKGAWKGRTIFKILPGGLENRTSVKVRSTSSANVQEHLLYYQLPLHLLGLLVQGSKELPHHAMDHDHVSPWTDSL